MPENETCQLLLTLLLKRDDGLKIMFNSVVRPSGDGSPGARGQV